MPIPRDYRDKQNPRLTMLSLLGYVISSYGMFTSKDISNHYGFSLAEAGSRLNVLKRYGLIKRIKTTPSGKRPYVYEVTAWGLKFYKDKKGDK